MTQRIRELLDEAVADLEPGSHDPVGVVVRRGRSQLRRAMAAAALAVVVLLGGGLAIGRGATRPGPPPTAAGTTDPATPHLVGGAVVAGALWLPVPDGWKVLTNDPARPCGDLPDTVLLVTTNNGGCQYAPIEVYGINGGDPGGSLVAGTVVDPIVQPPTAVTLRGGEPVWLMHPLNDRSSGAYWNVLALPWSGVSVQLRVDGPEQRHIIQSMASEPREAGPLVLPQTAASAELTTPDASGKITAAGHRKIKDPTAIGEVLTLLGSQRTVVENTDACASDSQHTARLTLAEGAAPESARTTVVISLGKRCQEAVSSDGGRVRLTDATLTQLKSLFGIGAR